MSEERYLFTDLTPEWSAIIQKRAFATGWSWSGAEKTVQYTKMPVLVFYPERYGMTKVFYHNSSVDLPITSKASNPAEWLTLLDKLCPLPMVAFCNLDPSLNVKIQERCLANGIQWQGGEKEIIHKEAGALALQNGKLSYGLQKDPALYKASGYYQIVTETEQQALETLDMLFDLEASQPAMKTEDYVLENLYPMASENIQKALLSHGWIWGGGLKTPSHLNEKTLTLIPVTKEIYYNKSSAPFKLFNNETEWKACLAELLGSAEPDPEPAIDEQPNNGPLIHKDFQRIKQWVTSRDKAGYPIPVWSYGPPGGGKTHVAEQIADELGVAFIPMTFGPTTTDTRVIGYLSAANGAYVEGPAYSWYKNGGLLFMDELDNCEPSALVSINALLANRKFRFPNGELLTKHRDCFALAGANTLGTGSQQGFRRQSQDAAARSRWAKVPFGYDERLEASLSQCPHWTAYVKRVRAEVDRIAKCNVWITPRDTIIGSAALANGVPEADVQAHLFAEFGEDVRQQILEKVGPFRRQAPEKPKASYSYFDELSKMHVKPDEQSIDLSQVTVPTHWKNKPVKKKLSEIKKDYV